MSTWRTLWGLLFRYPIFMRVQGFIYFSQVNATYFNIGHSWRSIAETWQPCRAWWRHDDVIKWKHFLYYWPFVRGILRLLVDSPHKGRWRGVLIFSLICLNTRLSKQWRRRRSRTLWRHCNSTGIVVPVMATRRHTAMEMKSHEKFLRINSILCGESPDYCCMCSYS